MPKRVIIGLILILGALILGLPYLVNWFYTLQMKEEAMVVRLFLHETGRVIRLSLDDYLTGVVAAEMPAAFPQEALKAQAVAARTYILKRIKAGGLANSRHPGADVCDDYRHGQAWVSRQEMRERWGLFRYYRYYYKIRRAVRDTRGLVITFKGQLIDPVYHSSCGGRGTENAGDVWKFDEPYLRSVPCPYDADPEPVRSVTLPLAEIAQKLRILPSAVLKPEVLKYTSAGRPQTIRFGSKTFFATEVRNILDLRSADFTMEVSGDEVKIVTRGYGHAVGLCQYGAKGLAEHGYSFEQILKHYYTGVKITRLKG